MAVAETIERKLTEALAPQRLKIVDDSEKHKGHGGYREGGDFEGVPVTAPEAANLALQLDPERSPIPLSPVDFLPLIESNGENVSGWIQAL